MIVKMMGANTVQDVGSDAEVDKLEREGVEMYDYDIFTGDVTLVFDGEKWLTEKPLIGPFSREG